jgi:transcriptional regulator with XRE-family HTH domain
MTNTKDIILKLKEVRQEKGLSFNDILNLMENNGDYLSKSTLSRVFADGSENSSFKYEETIRPIANALLDIETIEDTDNMDVQAMKSLLKYKIRVIEDLEQQIFTLKADLNTEKLKYHDKLDKERENFQKSLNFCREQINLKDKRIDQLLDANIKLLNQLLTCPCKKTGETECV